MTERCAPPISVIVPVHDKADTLAVVAKALGSQDAAPESFEIVFVDDHCSEACASQLAGLADRYGALLVLRRNGVASASGARNAGLAAARGACVLFLDADVVLAPDAISALLEQLPKSDEAVLVETYGSSVADEIWEFYAPSPDLAGRLDWDELSFLSDGRVSLADDSGYLDHLAAPWVFFWTTAVLISKALVSQLSGFDASLLGKGSEDIELGYRLYRHGARFRFAKRAKTLHLPHPRDRVEQEARDRVHERQTLGMHRELSMEMLCAFDAGNTEAALRAFDGLVPIWVEPTPQVRAKSVAMSDIGSGEIYVGPWVPDSIDEVFNLVGRLVRRNPLIGFALPDGDQVFAAALLADVRGFWPEAALCRLFQEASRVARRVFVLRWSRLQRFANSISEDEWRRFDRPYWERSQTISRSLYDWCARRVDRILTDFPDTTLDVIEVKPAADFMARRQRSGQ